MGRLVVKQSTRRRLSFLKSVLLEYTAAKPVSIALVSAALHSGLEYIAAKPVSITLISATLHSGLKYIATKPDINTLLNATLIQS
jgi:hypothetical protein